MDESSTFIDYKNEAIENDRSSPKEILNNLLKQMLGHKLNKLEKRHAEESNSLKIMSKISQNIIISLEHYSHKARKEIYKIRHRNDENHSKKRESIKNANDINKLLWKEEKNNINEDNNIESMINKQSFEKKNEKRFSKSIDPRKDKSFMSETSNNAKEKKSKKEKMDVFARLTSKSIGNFKKLKLDINGPSNSGVPHLLSSKSKNKKLTSSSKSIHNLVNKKNDADKEKDKNNSPSNNISVKNSKKLISTPKLKQKQLKKLAQIKLEDSNNTLGTQSSKNMVTSSKIKKTNSKGKLTKRLSKALAGLKQEEKNIVINNFVKKNSEILPENNDNKVNNEIKIESKKDSNK
jgi:hypothetical protein